LGLGEFQQARLPEGREAVSWAKVLQLLTALDELLEADYAVAEKDRLYRCLDRVLDFVWTPGMHSWAQDKGSGVD